MSESPVVRVHIFGSEYQIASPIDAEHTREVARYIDRKMREVAQSVSLRSVSKIAVLTAVRRLQIWPTKEPQSLHVRLIDLLENSGCF
jgi:cell division protein ZapA (FtsZ GTPase activity inhibitor)